MTVLTTLRVLLSRVGDVILRRQRDERLTEEVQTHLDLLTAEYIARGMTAEDARVAARRAFGGVDQLKAVYRDQRGLPFFDALTQDVRFALRLMRRDRAFSITAVLVLGIGIGVNNMLFTILNAHTMRGLPIAEADRVIYVSTVDDRGAERGVSYLDYVDLESAAQSFAGLAAFTSASIAVAGDGRAADRFEGTFVSANAFDLIGLRPALGRSFAADDDRPDAAMAVILGSGAWHARYASDPTILGRPLVVNGAPATIVAVVPDRSGFPSTADVWIPLSHAPGLAAQKRDARTLRVFGRVRGDVSTADARTEVETIFSRLSRDHPDTHANVRARAVPINERFLGRVTHPAWLAFITAGCLVVLISSANVANLMLGRSVHRTREMAIRTSLGASRRRIVRQLLIEGALLAAIGGVVGLAFALGAVRLFRSAIPANALPYWIDYSMDARVAGALVVVSMATVFVFALLPAIRTSKTDVNHILKDGGRTGPGIRGTRRWTTVFLAAEFALAVVLLAQVVVSFRTSRPPLPSDPIIDTTEVLTAAITLPADAYRTPEQRAAFYQRFEERVRAIPGVSSMSLASALPLMGVPEALLDIAGRPKADAEFQPRVRTVFVGPGYFDTLALALTRGRGFHENSGTAGHAEALVNERFVRQHFADSEVIGQRIAVSAPDAANAARGWLTIVGVAPDIRQRQDPDPDPIVYLPYRADPGITAAVLVRSRADTTSLVSLLRKEIVALDPNVPLYRVQTMAGVKRDARWNPRLAHMLVLVLTWIAVGLSTVGLYAVTAHGVSQRTPEIGVRMALGAQPRHVVAMVVRRALAQLTLGFLAGIVCTLAWSRMFGSGSAEVRVTDPESLIAIAAVLTVAAVIACFVPARRATRLDPVVAIRGD